MQAAALSGTLGDMDSTGTTRLLAVGSLMGAATAIRMGRTYVKAAPEQTLELLDLWLDASEPKPKADAAKKFRTGVIDAARKNTQSVLNEVELALEDVDWLTTPRKERKDKTRPSARTRLASKPPKRKPRPKRSPKPSPKRRKPAGKPTPT
jgi:hypothetical protein